MKNYLEVNISGCFADFEVNISGQVEKLSKATIQVKLKRIISDLQQVYELLEGNQDITLTNKNVGGSGGYDWDYIAN